MRRRETKVNWASINHDKSPGKKVSHAKLLALVNELNAYGYIGKHCFSSARKKSFSFFTESYRVYKKVNGSNRTFKLAATRSSKSGTRSYTLENFRMLLLIPLV